MRARLGRLLVELAASIAGGCPCRPCARARELDATARRHARHLSRRERREIHRGAWSLGRHPRRGGPAT